MAGGGSLGPLTSLEMAAVGRWVTSKWTCSASPVELGQFRAEVRAHARMILLDAFQVARGEDLVPVLGHENQVGVQEEDTVLPVWISLYLAMNSNIFSECSSGTTTASIRGHTTGSP
jgi:hypothetical protein